MKVQQILTEGWNDLTLYPESIPHLLHWDLAYLWILRTEGALCPDSWRWRVQAWERLLKHFLAGKLSREEESIQEPLLSYTRPFGISSVTKLIHVSGSERTVVGVLSPICLVRPLPEASEGLLKLLPDDPHDQKPMGYFLELLNDQLNKLVTANATPPNHGEPRADRRLQEDLHKVVKRLAVDYPGQDAYPGVEIDLQLLRSISFSRSGAEGLGASFDSIKCFAYDRSKSVEPRFVPRCDRCKVALTRQDKPENAIQVRGSTLDVSCPSCNRPNRIPLENLFIWRREKAQMTPEYVCWTDRVGRFTSPSYPEVTEWPPEIEGEEGGVVFRWNSAFLGSHANGPALRLQFPDANFLCASVTEDVLYQKLTVPGGEPNKFTGLPVRFDWRDAWQSAKCEPRADRVGFSEIRIHGLPFSFSQSYQSLSLELDHALAVGIYPKPMHRNWIPYRAVVLKGGTFPEYHLRMENAVELSTMCQESKGWPTWLSVETGDQKKGVTWNLRPVYEHAVGPGPVQEQKRVRVGIDFGTTNTVVYFQQQDSSSLQTDENSVGLEDFGKLMHWLPTLAPGLDAGWFLPATLPPGADKFLVPTAVWKMANGLYPIRWGARPPQCEGDEHGFKWDDGLQDRSTIRKAYLRDLFFFSLPVILERLKNRVAVVALDIAFAYPLAFNSRQRAAFLGLIQEFRKDFGKESGFNITDFHINESEAAVRASGAPSPGSLFLVADMGGRTLDLALFAYRPDGGDAPEQTLYQIGSIDFGGEAFLEAVTRARTQTTAGEDFEKEYWNLRNKIHRGADTDALQHEAAVSKALEILQTVALEYLRTMLKALIEHPPQDVAEQASVLKIRLRLIGNAWKLRQLVAGAEERSRFMHEYFVDSIGKFGLPGVEVDGPIIPKISDSKHWVACGALRAIPQQPKELEGQPYGSKLPAGRKMTLQDESLEWWELIGTRGRKIDNITARQGHLNCDVTSVPEMHPEWKRIFDHYVPANGRYPMDDALRDLLLRSVEQGTFLKGPLQLLMEKHWKGKL